MAGTPVPRRRRAGRIVYWVLFALAVAGIIASFAWIRLAGRGDQPSAVTFSVTLQPGQLWALGDHRSIAIDSRMWGPVPVSDVIGRVVAMFGGGAPELLLHTPQAFVTAGLAPADQRTPWVFVAFSLGIVAAPILVILIVFGVIRTLIRRNRRRRSPGAFTAGPAS
jgi:Signal peptidase, peptidase S26